MELFQDFTCYHRGFCAGSHIFLDGLGRRHLPNLPSPSSVPILTGHLVEWTRQFVDADDSTGPHHPPPPLQTGLIPPADRTYPHTTTPVNPVSLPQVLHLLFC